MCIRDRYYGIFRNGLLAFSNVQILLFALRSHFATILFCAFCLTSKDHPDSIALFSSSGLHINAATFWFYRYVTCRVCFLLGSHFLLTLWLGLLLLFLLEWTYDYFLAPFNNFSFVFFFSLFLFDSDTFKRMR